MKSTQSENHNIKTVVYTACVLPKTTQTMKGILIPFSTLG